MPGMFRHEQAYRGPGALEKLAAAKLTVCGVGALGSHVAESLARQGVTRIRLIDHDRVEEHNVGCQVYGLTDVGAKKVDVLRGVLYRATGTEAEAVAKRLDERTARTLLKDAGVVVDAFDNSDSRRLVQERCRALALPCLHVGLFADYGEVVWDEQYRVPADAAGDVCDYPLARSLVLLTAAVACEVLARFLANGVRASWSITLRDFAVKPLEPG